MADIIRYTAKYFSLLKNLTIRYNKKNILTWFRQTLTSKWAHDRSLLECSAVSNGCLYSAEKLLWHWPNFIPPICANCTTHVILANLQGLQKINRNIYPSRSSLCDAWMDLSVYLPTPFSCTSRYIGMCAGQPALCVITKREHLNS